VPAERGNVKKRRTVRRERGIRRFMVIVSTIVDKLF
jgi:hypothetical protein